MRMSVARRLKPRLLLVLEAVIAEGNLTKAGNRLGISQSAVSHALGRLKSHVGAELFERRQRGLQPTPLALEIAADVRAALARLQMALSPPKAFDPRTGNQMFLLDLPAGLDALIAPRLAERVQGSPGLSFRLLGGRASTIRNELRARESWLALDHEALTDNGFRSEPLFEDRLVLVSRRQHPAIRSPVNRARYEALQHVAVSTPRSLGVVPVSAFLEAAGIVRDLRFTVPSLSTVIDLVENLDYVTTMIGRIARDYARTRAIDVHELAIGLPPLRFHMIWHESFETNPGHAWLRQQLREICAGIDGMPPPDPPPAAASARRRRRAKQP